MKYHCNQCGRDFELSDGGKIRCPGCMGIHNIDPLDGGQMRDSAAPLRRPSMFVASALLLSTLIAVGGYLLWLHYAGNTGESTKLSSAELGRQMQSLGLDAADATVPYEVTQNVSTFARGHAADVTGEDAIKALMAAITSLKKDGRMTVFRQGEPRMEDALTADALAGRMLRADAAETSVSSYELACLLLASGNALDVRNLHMVELFSYRGEKKPADPHAIYGRYAVSVGMPGEGRTVAVFDPWAGRTVDSAQVDLQVLSVQEAAAPWYAHRSLAAFARMDFAAARKENDVAVRLAPANASFLIHRGKIFLASGAIEEGMAEFEKARKLKNWAVTRASLAQVSMLKDPSGASTEAEIRKALHEFPEYVQAHLILALIQAQGGQREAAGATLRSAEALEPMSAEVATAWTQFHLLHRDTDAAIASALKAARLSGESPTSLIMLAQVYQATARFDEARSAAMRAIEKIPAPEMQQQLRQAFNITDDVSVVGADDAASSLDSDSPPLPDAKKNLELQFEQPGGTSLGGGKLRLGGDSLRLNR